ncbi:hypothetical protein [Roseobacter sp. S98]|uniref:hypothetical protein n=1 Tax=Roseobacter algicola (ex Choi et al. 2025) (nom. illeg.) TaxID=3092138 RepID=UPI0035C6F60B
MRHAVISEKPCAESILAMAGNEVGAFVERCIRDRSLSRLVSDLNNALMSGTPNEQEKARKALQHMGFI